MGHGVIDVTDSTWDEQVTRNNQPVLVDFWADWCMPCRKLAPIIEQIAQEMGDRISVVKVDIQNNPGIAAQYGVLSAPTVSVFKAGNVIKSMQGFKSKTALVKMVNESI